MALQGNLRDFPFSQLLNLINLANKTGRLVVESPAQSAEVVFREGKLAFAQFRHDDASLAAVLLRGGKISQAQYQILQQRAAQMNDKELGLLLINAGYLSQADVLKTLQDDYCDVLQRLFGWAEGAFYFEADEPSPENRITVKMDLENLIIEGSRQVHELSHLQEEIPSLDVSLKFRERPDRDLKDIHLSVQEWKVISYVNPKNTLRQIAAATDMNEIEIRRVVYSLVQAGVVEMVRPGGNFAWNSTNMFPSKDRTEQKSLVNRLIQRIRSI